MLVLTLVTWCLCCSEGPVVEPSLQILLLQVFLPALLEQGHTKVSPPCRTVLPCTSANCTLLELENDVVLPHIVF